MSKAGTDTAFLETVTPEGVAVVTLDHFPVNSLSANVNNGLTKVILEIEKEQGKKIKGVVLRGAGRAFCAGADISAFGQKGNVEKVSLGRPSSDMWGFEELQVPVVAAIHGFALGGGFELALSCHYRVIASDAEVGLPEVNIGLLPGGQGTQRLPRLIGSEHALTLMTSGNHAKAPQALKMGVVEEVVPKGADLLAAAIKLCVAKMGQPVTRISAKPPPNPVDFATWQQKMAKARPGEIAPSAIIRCVEGACKGPTFADGVNLEIAEFKVLVASPESAALRHQFFAERAGANVEGLTAKPQPIKSVGIVGAGLMGGGIAMCNVNVGIPVTLLDVDAANLERGMKLIKANYERSVTRGSRSRESADKCLSMITATTKYEDFKDCDLIVEAVFEEMGIKKKIFETLDKVCKPGAFLCSNTSALDIDQIASMTSRPEFVMGTHFFSPANVMKLLENVRGSKTSDLTIASMMAWGKKIGKWAILVGNCPGFVGNRMIALYNEQARELLYEGAFPPDVDKALLDFGMKMGPLAMSDLVGLDLGIQAIQKAGQYDPKKVIQHALVDTKRLGLKAKAGFFDYNEKGQPVPSEVVKNMILEVSKNKRGTPDRRQISDDEIVHRLIFPLINEGFKILEEGHAQRPADIDVCYVHGYSFPRPRGGPMHYADHVGLPFIKSTLEKLGVKPAALLETCVSEGTPLTKYWAKNGKSILAKAAASRTSKL